jgi:hypothetical protein
VRAARGVSPTTGCAITASTSGVFPASVPCWPATGAGLHRDRPRRRRRRPLRGRGRPARRPRVHGGAAARAGERTFGVLTLDRTRCEVFPPTVVDLVEVYAQMLALALVNAEQRATLARLRAQAQEQVRLIEHDMVGDSPGVFETSRSAVDAGGRAAGPSGGRHRHPRAHPRRDRHRQGAPRPQPARVVAATRAALREAQLRGHPRGPAGERAVWPRPGRLHRRDPRPGGAIPDGQRGHAAARRDWRAADGASGQAAAGAAGGHLRARRQRQHREGRRTHPRRHPRRPRTRRRRGPLPRRPVLPAQRVSAAPSGPARAPRRPRHPVLGAARRPRASHRSRAAWW